MGWGTAEGRWSPALAWPAGGAGELAPWPGLGTGEALLGEEVGCPDGAGTGKKGDGWTCKHTGALAEGCVADWHHDTSGHKTGLGVAGSSGQAACPETRRTERSHDLLPRRVCSAA